MVDNAQRDSSLLDNSAGEPKRLAVFDFDGTTIKGSSSVRLVRYLFVHRFLKLRLIAPILFWGLAYKLRLHQNESWVRGLVFSAFEGRPVQEVDDFLAKFYDEHIADKVHPEAYRAMQDRASEGDIVVMISATFEPIIRRAMETLPFEYEISTRMHVNSDGAYTREVEGLPVEGAEKLACAIRFGDEQFGSGNWKLSYAYGDHHSDTPVLEASENPCVVNPDRPLKRTAEKRHWKIVDW